MAREGESGDVVVVWWNGDASDNINPSQRLLTFHRSGSHLPEKAGTLYVSGGQHRTEQVTARYKGLKKKYRSPLPNNSIFLCASGDADTEQVTAKYQGRAGNTASHLPEYSICLYSTGET